MNCVCYARRPAAKRPKLAFDEAEADMPTAAAAGADDAALGSSRQPQQRHFRGQRVETPSHPGGVSTPARETLEASKQRQKERDRSGLYASTSGRGGSGSERDRDRDGRSERGEDRNARGDYRDRDSRQGGSSSRDRESERSSRDRDSRDRDSRRDYDSRDRDRRDYDRSDRGGHSERSERDYRGGSGSRDGSDRRPTGGSSRRDTATPLRQAPDDADGGWGSTPARPGSNAPSGTPLRDTRDHRAMAAPSPWESTDAGGHRVPLMFRLAKYSSCCLFSAVWATPASGLSLCF